MSKQKRLRLCQAIIMSMAIGTAISYAPDAGFQTDEYSVLPGSATATTARNSFSAILSVPEGKLQIRYAGDGSPFTMNTGRVAQSIGQERINVIGTNETLSVEGIEMDKTKFLSLLKIDPTNPTNKAESVINAVKALLLGRTFNPEPASGSSREIVEQRNPTASESRQTNAAGRMFGQPELLREFSECLAGDPLGVTFGSRHVQPDVITCYPVLHLVRVPELEREFVSCRFVFKGAMPWKVEVCCDITCEAYQELKRVNTYGHLLDKLKEFFRQTLSKVAKNSARVSRRQYIREDNIRENNNKTIFMSYAVNVLDGLEGIDNRLSCFILVDGLEPGSEMESFLRNGMASNEKLEGSLEETGGYAILDLLYRVSWLVQSQVRYAIDAPKLVNPGLGHQIVPVATVVRTSDEERLPFASFDWPEIEVTTNRQQADDAENLQQ